jgi:class 3 adenylate cyclase/tetratricopeptide (TPR) repeat protein
MKCPKCQFDNKVGAKFCKECGNKLELTCPQCENAYTPGAKFCDECGHDLQAPKKEAPLIAYDQPQSYTPKHLADKILTTRASIEGERKVVTVLFADVANSTAIFEKFDPEDVHQVMDGCFRILMDEIHRYEGTVNQFRGDCVMALFGAPLAHEDHAQRACFASLCIQRAMKGYSEDMRARFGLEFKMRIGLNSGLVVVGSIGNDLRMDYTADGDTANLASRMESLAKPDTVLVSGNTYNLAENYFEFEPLGKVQVNGKAVPQEAYVLLRPSDIRTRIAASADRGLTRFVGRTRELETIKEAFNKAGSGQGQVVGIVGEAGVGKSRLLFELRSVLPRGGYTYFEGHCLHYGGSMPYLPILDVFRSYVGIKEGEQESIIKKKMNDRILGLDETLKSAIPPLEEFLSLKIEDEEYAKLEPKKKKERTFESIRDLLIRGSQERPLILAIEDLHWIDKTSEEFLGYMIRRLPNTRILLILLYRPEYTHAWGSKSYYSKIGVDQFSSNTSKELVRAILDGVDVMPELRDLILSRASGNPFFMEELTHSLLENGSILKKDDQYVLSAKASDIQVPDTIQGIIATRMDRLEESLKRIMQVASVIGREFAFPILHAITEMKDDVKSHLLNLQGLEFIYEKNLFPELEYVFKHALTQEVAYNSLLLKRRKEIHAKIGRAIEELYAERLEEFYERLAYHYSKSDSLEKAWRYSRLSGEKAEGTSSHREGCDFYKRAIDLLNKLPETAENKKEKMKVISLILPPLAFLGFPEGSLGILQQGEQLSKELGDERRLAKLYNAMGIYYSHKGDPQLGMKYSENAFKAARKNQDIELMPPLAFGLSISYAQTGEFYKIVDMAPDTIALIEKTGRETDSFSMGWNPYSLLCSFCGHGMGNLGAFDEGKAFLEKGLRNATKMNDLTALGLVEIQYGRFYLAKGDWEPSKEHFEKGIKYNEEANWVFGSAVSFLGLGYACAMLGDRETGKRHVEKGLEIQRDSGAEVFLSLAHFHLGWIHLDLGDLKNARSLAEEALRLSQKNNEKLIEGGAWVLLGTILGKTVPLEINKAEGCILKGIEIYKELKTKANYPLGHLYLGELYLNEGKNEKAIDNLKKAEGMFREMGMDYWLGKAQEVLAAL